jgi:DNA-directed RNA polymerase specialized sigma24 family protein
VPGPLLPPACVQPAYHRPTQYPQKEGPGLFPTLTNPYAFATAQVRHVLRAQGCGVLTREDVDDAVQDALLWAWERRHCAHIADFPGYISAVIREKLRKRSWRRA